MAGCSTRFADSPLSFSLRFQSVSDRFMLAGLMIPKISLHVRASRLRSLVSRNGINCQQSPAISTSPPLSAEYRDFKAVGSRNPVFASVLAISVVVMENGILVYGNVEAVGSAR